MPPRRQPADDAESVAANELRSFIERIERLEEERSSIAGEIREVYAEARATGFDPKVMRRIVSLRKRDVSERQEEAATMELYMQALGMTQR